MTINLYARGGLVFYGTKILFDTRRHLKPVSELKLDKIKRITPSAKRSFIGRPKYNLYGRPYELIGNPKTGCSSFVIQNNIAYAANVSFLENVLLQALEARRGCMDYVFKLLSLDLQAMVEFYNVSKLVVFSDEYIPLAETTDVPWVRGSLAVKSHDKVESFRQETLLKVLGKLDVKFLGGDWIVPSNKRCLEYLNDGSRVTRVSDTTTLAIGSFSPTPVSIVAKALGLFYESNRLGVWDPIAIQTLTCDKELSSSEDGSKDAIQSLRGMYTCKANLDSYDVD